MLMLLSNILQTSINQHEQLILMEHQLLKYNFLKHKFLLYQ